MQNRLRDRRSSLRWCRDSSPAIFQNGFGDRCSNDPYQAHPAQGLVGRKRDEALAGQSGDSYLDSDAAHGASFLAGRVRPLAFSYCTCVAPRTTPRSWDFSRMASVLQSSSSAALDKLIRHPSFRRVELDVKGDPHGGRALDLRANSLLPLPMRCRMLGDVRVWRWHS